MVRKRSSGSNSTTLGTKAGRKEMKSLIRGLIHIWLCMSVACRQAAALGGQKGHRHEQVTFSVRFPRVKWFHSFLFTPLLLLKWMLFGTYLLHHHPHPCVCTFMPRLVQDREQSWLLLLRYHPPCFLFFSFCFCFLAHSHWPVLYQVS